MIHFNINGKQIPIDKKWLKQRKEEKKWFTIPIEGGSWDGKNADILDLWLKDRFRKIELEERKEKDNEKKEK